RNHLRLSRPPRLPPKSADSGPAYLARATRSRTRIRRTSLRRIRTRRRRAANSLGSTGFYKVLLGSTGFVLLGFGGGTLQKRTNLAEPCRTPQNPVEPELLVVSTDWDVFPSDRRSSASAGAR